MKQKVGANLATKAIYRRGIKGDPIRKSALELTGHDRHIVLLSIDIAEGQTDKPDILLLNELDHFFWRVLHVFTCFLSFRPYVCRSNFFISEAIAARKLP